MTRNKSLTILSPQEASKLSRPPAGPIHGRVCFVVMPTVRTYSPAFGASLLKSYLAERGIESDVVYFNLRFREMIRAERDRLGLESSGDELYELGSRYWIGAGEWLFAQHLQGPDSVAARDYPELLLGARFDEFPRQLREDYLKLKGVVVPFLEHCLNAVNWDRYRMVGFSSMFAQQQASLALSKTLSERYELDIVFGGANCDGVMGRTMLELYPWIDQVFHGKADRSFPRFAEHFLRSEPFGDVPGLAYRKDGEVTVTGNPEGIGRLDNAPMPDFSDYFEQHQQSAFQAADPPYFLAEFSRGCYWAVKSHCIFCGLFGDKAAYQVKTADRATSELEAQFDRHGVRRLRLVDTILNPRHFKDVLPALAAGDVRYRFTCEIKADISRAQAQALSRAGCFWAQPGIESFSTKVLAIIRKGNTALQSVACLRHMREAGVRAGWNLIYGFPGEEPGDYDGILKILEAISHLDPPTFVGPLHLVRFSPAFDHAEAMGFENIRPCPVSRTLYPFDDSVLHNLCSTFEFDYANGVDPAQYTGAVVAQCRKWQKADDPGMLVYRSLNGAGGVLRDTRMGGGEGGDLRRLDPLQAAVYEACDEIVTMEQIEAQVGSVVGGDADRSMIEGAVQGLLESRVLLHDAGEYLSLALSNCDIVPWHAVAGLSEADVDETKREEPVIADGG